MASDGTEPADPARWADRPALVPPVERWRCWCCGGGGLDSAGETCEHCDGYGHTP